MLNEAQAKIKLGKYVKEHTLDLDEIMLKVFAQWNEIGKLGIDDEESNKMQVTFLISIMRIWLTKSGMPKDVQRANLQALLKNL